MAVVEEMVTDEESVDGGLNIDFVTIAQSAVLGDEPALPQYVVVTDPVQWQEQTGILADEVIAAGKEAYQQPGDIAIIAYAGVKNSSGYSIQIEQVIYSTTSLKVVVSESAPDANAMTEPATVLPYHLILISAGTFDMPGQMHVTFVDPKGSVLFEEDINL